jgi:hypothetical protein
MQFFFLSAQSLFHQWVNRRAGGRLGACLSRDALRLSYKFSHAESKVALVHVYFFSFGVDLLRSCTTLAQLTFLRLRFMTAGVVLTSIALNLITLWSEWDTYLLTCQLVTQLGSEDRVTSMMVCPRWELNVGSVPTL